MSLRPVPLIERRAALQEINTAPGNARYSEHFEENGGLVFRLACRLGLKAWSRSSANPLLNAHDLRRLSHSCRTLNNRAFQPPPQASATVGVLY